MISLHSVWHQGIKIGLIGGVVALLVCLIGMVETFSQRYIIGNVISMGHTLLLIVGIFVGYLSAARTSHSHYLMTFINCILAEEVVAFFLVLLLVLGHAVNLRSVFINASPVLYNLLSFGQGLERGSISLLAVGGLGGLFAGYLYLSPDLVRRVVMTSLSGVVLAGVLQDLLKPTLAAWGPMAMVGGWLFTPNGLSIHGALSLSILIGAIVSLWVRKKEAIETEFRSLPVKRQQTLRSVGLLLLFVVFLILPQIVGLFLSEVLTIVGLYVLLGLGLNIVVGYAGLLDLGYVAFFAIGAYTAAVLTSPELGFFNLTVWEALPFAILMGIISGVLLGIPVLKMRGDYLAIATLGFGEIIRILVLSDFLRPWLGGAQGVGEIPRPAIGNLEFATPQRIYYLILAGCMLVILIALRLRNSRIGRAWMAMREDEDVAQAMGINLVAAKLLAFATGAGFSALSGAIFASKLGSVYPHSFNVMISINVICLIIVGGLGSIPGVIVGAAALVGLPELLREFAEYRLLVYGAALVAMMLLKPEGLWPEALHRREMHRGETPEKQSASKSNSVSGT